VIPLDEFGTKYNVNPERYAPAFRPIVMHPDETGKRRMWATVHTGGTVCLYYNRAWLRSAGFDTPPRTIAELDAMALELTQRAADGSIERAGFLHTEPGWWSSLWCSYFGGRLYDEETNRAMVDSPESKAALEWAAAWSDKIGVEHARRFKSAFATAYGSPQNAFVSGKVAMVVQGPWLANVINEFNPGLDYGVAPVPVPEAIYDPKSPVGLVDSDVLVIPRGVREPEACMEFVAYTQRQDAVEFLSKAHFKNSPLASVSEEFTRTHPNKGVRVHDAIANSPRGFLCPRTRNWPEIKDELDALFSRVWGHEAEIAPELAAIQVRVQAGLDRTLAKRRLRWEGEGA
jgi:maltose-binding protein MalE